MWKDVPGYEGYYQTSNTGLIRSSANRLIKNNGFYGDKTLGERLVKPVLGKDGRERVLLCKDGVKKGWLLSRLVAITWVDGYAEGLTVNHINGNRTDNRVENLEWITRKDNILHAHQTGLYPQPKRVDLIAPDGKMLSFSSMSEASRYLGKCVGYISNHLKRGRPLTLLSGYKIDIKEAPMFDTSRIQRDIRQRH